LATLIRSVIRSVWILDEDAQCRAAVAVAVESAGYHDIVAFEDAQQLLAYRPSGTPELAVIDSWTARYDAGQIHGALSGALLVVLVSADEYGEPWRSLGVEHLLPKPLSTQALGVAGFDASEAPSGARAVQPELRASLGAARGDVDDSTTEYAMLHQERRPLTPSGKALEQLLARLGSAH
jgi:hypothetical protein